MLMAAFSPYLKAKSSLANASRQLEAEDLMEGVRVAA
jgi:hypothetical protein